MKDEIEQLTKPICHTANNRNNKWQSW